MTIGHLPQLPLVCLKSADSRNTEDVVRGKATIIDFWTTKCVRCPSALDKLDRMAQEPKYSDVQFVSICCDKLDGARNIIEKDEDLRWQHVSHFFMEQEDKEKAKQQLGFKSVPFYVVVDEDGEIQQMGGERKIDFDEVPGVVRPETPVYEEEEKDDREFMLRVDDGFGDMPDIVRPTMKTMGSALSHRPMPTTFSTMSSFVAVTPSTTITSNAAVSERRTDFSVPVSHVSEERVFVIDEDF